MASKSRSIACAGVRTLGPSGKLCAANNVGEISFELCFCRAHAHRSTPQH
jgi:hypothetical protein